MLWWYSRLRAVSLFSVVRRAKRETRKWPRARLNRKKKGDCSQSSGIATIVLTQFAEQHMAL